MITDVWLIIFFFFNCWNKIKDFIFPPFILERSYFALKLTLKEKNKKKKYFFPYTEKKKKRVERDT